MAEADLVEIDVSKFKQAVLKDQPQPLLQWVDIEGLVIDRSYQRDITPVGARAIQKIANDFDWSKFEPILCAPTIDGRLAVVDGQHRAHASALVGLKKIPAMVVPMTPSQQAAGFTAINRDRIKIHPQAIFRAELAGGVEWAVQANGLVLDAGCKMATSNPSSTARKPKIVYCVGLIKKMVLAGEGIVVSSGLQAIVNGSLSEEVRSYDGSILSIWLPAIASNQRYMKADLVSVFEQFDFDCRLDASRIKARQTGQSARSIVIQELTDVLRAVLDAESLAA